MLEITGTEYRLEDLRKIGQQAEETHGTKIRPETRLGHDDLLYRHLLDPRVPILLTSRKRYKFASWTELFRVLDDSWRYNEKDERTQAIPQAVEKYFVPYRIKPFTVTSEMRMEDLLTTLREHSGEPSELITVPNEDVSWAQARSADRLSRENALQKLWGACGPASQSLNERLVGLGGAPVVTYQRIFEGVEDARLLEAFLRIGVRETLFIQISERSIHEFTIEKRPDGTAYLHQGYLSGYSAMWWAGVKGSDRSPFFSLTGTNATKMGEARNTYGLGRPIPLDRFAELMGGYLLADVHGPKAAQVWAQLPFNPGAAEEDSRWAGNSIALEVKVIQLADETAARKALGDGAGKTPLTTLIMREAEGLLNK